MDSMRPADLASRPAADGAGLDGLLLDPSTLGGVPHRLWAGGRLRFRVRRTARRRGAEARGGPAGRRVCRVAAHGDCV